MRKLSELLKDILYITLTNVTDKTWKIFKPRTHGARILLATDTHVLLVKRRAANYWNLPGGGISRTEDPAQGALRELYEETKIKLEKVDFLLGTYVSSREGKKDTIYIVTKKVFEKLEAKITFELQDAGWFPWDQLPETTTPATRYRIEEYLHGLQGVQGKWMEPHGVY